MNDSVVEIIGLSKRFGAGVLAVDDLTFDVERGQICGLLGPNGAGKTTCLRMLLGLIRPSSGETRLFGERVRPGSEQLRRVGALIETAAFVPHLSGMRNLRLWWESGGARWSDAHLEEALAIADLGTAIDRKVKTYSQGMRQRLGLARVLLGQPEILVLDEPTNGLDPQEMREVRQLVHRVADAGATVLFSSHVLAEVEQTCTHAVVMDRGKFVAGGSVASLIGTSGSVYLEVSDAARAQQVLGSFPNVLSITPEAPGLSVEMRDHSSRAEMVKALVDAGIGVDTVMLRRRLEDAFLGLVEAERA
ncbi:MAG: ABC transporter ATP-binding protein [Acidimicrobiia bacterium]